MPPSSAAAAPAAARGSGKGSSGETRATTGSTQAGTSRQAPVTITTVDGFLRRWVDVVWTSSGTLRRIDPRQVLRVYYGFLAGYVVMSAAFLAFASPLWLVIVAANVNNFALGLSCLHTLAVNTRLLPPALRPGLGSRLALGTAGLYFLSLAALTVWIIT